MRYEIPVIFFGRSAKNKAIVSDMVPSNGPDKWVVIDAKDDADAWAQVVKTVLPGDKRPIAGKSYIRYSRIKADEGQAFPVQYKEGQRVKLHTPYSGMSVNSFQLGEISEVLSDTVYSIALDGYHNRYVDFSTREFVAISQ